MATGKDHCVRDRNLRQLSDTGSERDRGSKIRSWSWMARKLMMSLTETDNTEDAKTDDDSQEAEGSEKD